MGTHITLDSAGGAQIGAYLAKPVGKPRGGIIVVQEIFGVTPHIRDVIDRFAAAGYTAIAPAFFDFVEPGIELAYDNSGMQRGKHLAIEVGLDRATEAVASATGAIKAAGKVGVVGFCWGGTVALLSAQRLALPAVSYYGARNTGYLDQPLKAPVIFHFGTTDRSITAEVRAQHRQAWPDAPVYEYEHCGHAFNRDVDKNAYNEAAAKLAWQRTLAFFGEHLAGKA